MNMAAQEKKWQVQADAETLIRAKEIQQDKKRYSAALKYCREKCEALDRVIEGSGGKK